MITNPNLEESKGTNQLTFDCVHEMPKIVQLIDDINKQCVNNFRFTELTQCGCTEVLSCCMEHNTGTAHDGFLPQG